MAIESEQTAVAPGRQDAVDTLLGVLITAAFLSVFWVSTQMPTTALHDPMRDVFRQWHFNLGLLLMVFLGVRLWTWRKKPQPLPPPGMPDSAFNFWRTLLKIFYISLFLMGIIGICHLLASGFPLMIAGVFTIQPPIGPNGAAWQFFGYAHSIFGFYYIMLMLVMLIVGLWQAVRYRAGVLRLLPGPAV